MSTAMLSSKGRSRFPLRCAAVGIETGDRVEFVEAQGHYELVAATLPATALSLVAAHDQPVSVDDMNAAVRLRAAKDMEL